MIKPSTIFKNYKTELQKQHLTCFHIFFLFRLDPDSFPVMRIWITGSKNNEKFECTVNMFPLLDTE